MLGKVCSKCKIEKPLTAFSKNRSRKNETKKLRRRLSMSNAFKPIDFDALVPPEPKKKVVADPFDAEKLKLAVAKVKQEIENIADGTSIYLKRAVNFGAIGCPAQNQLRIFAAKPTMTNFKGFIQLAHQDFSSRPAKAMEEILLTALAEKPSAKA